MKTNDFQSKLFNLNVLFVFGRHFGCQYLVILRGRTDLNLKPRLFAFLLKAHRNLKRLLCVQPTLQFLEFSTKTVILCRRKKNYRVFSLTWPASVCKFIGTKESVYIRKEFNFHRTSLWPQHGSLRTADAFPVVASQHGRRFIVLGHQYGRRDVMWKHSIPVYSVDTYWLKRHVMQLVSRYNCEHDLLWRTCENRTNNSIDWNLQERYWTLWSLFLSIKIWFKSKSPARKWTRKCAFSFYLIYNRVIPGVI